MTRMLFLIALVLPVTCREAVDPAERRLHEQRALLRDTYSFSSAADSREAAVRHLFTAAARGDEVALRSFVFSDEEYRSIYWPNELDKFVRGTPAEAAAFMNAHDRLKGLRRLTKLAGKNVAVLGISWDDEELFREKIRLHRVRAVSLSVNGKRIDFSPVGLVAEHAGQFKMAVLQND